MNGRITVKIVSDGVSETPCFQSGQSEVQFNLSHGEVTIDSLIIQSQCDGRDGQEYVLRFEASLGRKNLYNIEPYSLPFLFYNGNIGFIFIRLLVLGDNFLTFR